MVAAVGGWVAFSEWGTLNLWEIEQEKASTLWPQVICTSRVTSVGPLGCHTIQGILDLFTPHLASKATTMGGGRRRVKYWNRGTSCRLEPWRESSASFFLKTGARSAYSHLDFVCCWLGDRLIRGRWMHVSRWTRHMYRLQTELETTIVM